MKLSFMNIRETEHFITHSNLLFRKKRNKLRVCISRVPSIPSFLNFTGTPKVHLHFKFLHIKPLLSNSHRGLSSFPFFFLLKTNPLLPVLDKYKGQSLKLTIFFLKQKATFYNGTHPFQLPLLISIKKLLPALAKMLWFECSSSMKMFKVSFFTVMATAR